VKKCVERFTQTLERSASACAREIERETAQSTRKREPLDARVARSIERRPIESCN
jgi:hypothetical protein